MGTYQVGLETRQKIYNVATKLFYEKGFIKTTCLQIAKESNANVGLINYYFGSKGALGAEIYSTSITAIKEAVKAAIETKYDHYDLLTATAVEFRVIAHNMAENPKFARFYLEILGENVLYEEDSSGCLYYKELAEAYHLDTTTSSLDMMIYGNFGAHQGLLMARNAGRLTCDYQEEGTLSICLMMRIMGFQSKQILEIVEKSQIIENELSIQITDNFTVST